MAETPEERLARLRREVESSWTPPQGPVASLPATAPAAPVAPAASNLASTQATAPAASAHPAVASPGGPVAPARPVAGPVPVTSGRRSVSPTDPAIGPAGPAPSPPAPTREPVAPERPVAGPVPASAASVPHAATPDPVASDGPHTAPDTVRVLPPHRAAPPPATPLAIPPTEGDGWSLADALGGAGPGQWVAIGLVVVGGYLLLALLVPGIAFPGSVVMTGAGVVLLWLHFTRRGGTWALYAGATLAAVGALRAVGDLMPFEVNGETSLGLGLAFLSIGYLRHSQAGGHGWQGVLGLVALGWGGIQLVLGWLPGAPGILDLVVPVVILGAGVLLLVRTSGGKAGGGTQEEA